MKTCFAFIRLAIISVPVLILAACGSSGGGGGGGGTVNGNDVNLASLTVSAGTLTPAFSQSVVSYAVEVPNTQTTITVTAEAVSDSADVTINGTGNDSSALSVIELEEGLNTATVTVRAPDATEKTYTITITRLAPGLSSNANLAGLELSSGTLTPAFSATTTSYTAEVANTVTSITVTPTVAGINALVKVNNVSVSSGTASGSISLSVGSNTVTVEITAEDGTKKTYTVAAGRLSDVLSNNANLANLTLSTGILSPAFAASTTAYTVDLDCMTKSMTITPTTEDTNATVTVNGTPVTSGTASGSITLAPYANAITIAVTAQSGIVKNYVITVNRDGEWYQDAYLKASNAESDDYFGFPVSISGDTIVVGAEQEDSNQTTITNTDGSASTDNSASNAGAVYVFKCDASGNWYQDAYLKASNAGAENWFKVVSISGDTIVVGAAGESSNQSTITNTNGSASADNSASYSGAAYVFKCNVSGNWYQDAYLKASNPGAEDDFGVSASISEDTIVVGAWGEDSNQSTITNTNGSASADNSAVDSGAAYVFKCDASGNWYQDAYLKASNTGAEDGFGGVSISGDTIVVGAWGEDSNQSTITNTDGSASADNSAVDSGAAYVFKCDASGNWYQDAYLKASNAGAEDGFSDVSISGDTIVVGAWGEDSNQTTITNTNGSASADNSTAGSGAAYVFKCDAFGIWYQDAYLKASNTGADDYFGFPVSISGDTIVVGAGGEDSNQSTIINTDGSASANNSASESGAAYVFKCDASGNWYQDAYLKASNAGADDYFGESVSISGDTIVVGASQEDSNQTSITNTDGSASTDNSAGNAGAVYVFKIR